MHRPNNDRVMSGRGSRRSVLKLSLAAAALTALPAAGALAQGGQKVTVGHQHTMTDIVFYIAAEKGYFSKEGLDVELVPFKSGADMVAALASGQLDVGSGGPSASLYNAVSRGLPIKMVADRGRPLPGYSYANLLVRTALLDSGEFKSFADLKGRKIAGYAKDSSTEVWFSRMLEQGGVSEDDVTRAFLPAPEHIVALTNGAVDASVTAEPQSTIAVRSGAAKVFAGADVVYADQQVSGVYYSGRFIEENRPGGLAFMRAWKGAVAEYNRALVNAKLTGEGADGIIDILLKYIKVDKELVQSINNPSIREDGFINMESMRNDLDYYRKRGFITSDTITAEDVVDESFVKELSN